MGIIFGTGYSEEEKHSLVKFVCQHIFMTMHSMICAMNKLKIRYRDPRNEVRTLFAIFIDFLLFFSTNMLHSCAQLIIKLWQHFNLNMLKRLKVFGTILEYRSAMIGEENINYQIQLNSKTTVLFIRNHFSC